jgi:hypothetical protein
MKPIGTDSYLLTEKCGLRWQIYEGNTIYPFWKTSVNEWDSSVRLAHHRLMNMNVGQESTDEKTFWFRYGKVIKVSLGILSFLMLGTWAFYKVSGIGVAAADYTKNREKALSLGYFLTTEEYQKSLVPAGKTNGAEDMKAAIAIYTANKDAFKNVDFIKPEGRVSPDILGKILPHIEAAAKKDVCVFSRDYSSPAQTLFPEFSSVKPIVKAMSLHATLARQEGRSEEAFRYWSAVAHLCRMQDDETILIGQLVRIACESILMRSLETEVNRQPLLPSEQGPLDAVLRIMDEPVDVRAAFRTEHWFGSTMTFDAESLTYLISDSAQADTTALKVWSKMPRFMEANRSRIHEGVSVFEALAPMMSLAMRRRWRRSRSSRISLRT